MTAPNAPARPTTSRWPRLVPGILGAVALSGLAVWLAAPGPSHGSNPDPEPSDRVVPVLRDGVLELPASYAEMLGLTTEPAQARSFEPVLEVTGTVGFDETLVSAVGSRISGRLLELSVAEGDEVQVGAILGSIESAELGTAQADAIAAKARVEVSASHERRRRALLDEGVGSQRSMEEATAEAAVARADYLAARQRIVALGGDPASRKLGVALMRAPIAGQVIEVKGLRGQAVAASDNLFVIADLDRVWINLAVFEAELGRIAVGDTVELRPSANGDATILGEVRYVSPVIDVETRSGEVRVVADNRDRSLRVGQSIRAKIQAQGEARTAITIPRRALLRIDGQPTVFVALADHKVEIRAVEVGDASGDQVEIVAGLAAGERVVVDGAFALKSEIFR